MGVKIHFIRISIHLYVFSYKFNLNIPKLYIKRLNNIENAKKIT